LDNVVDVEKEECGGESAALWDSACDCLCVGLCVLGV
jgi:hypothetical protein